jgi:nucleosome binding factor SPN SPT16 subunit
MWYRSLTKLLFVSFIDILFLQECNFEIAKTMLEIHVHLLQPCMKLDATIQKHAITMLHPYK